MTDKYSYKMACYQNWRCFYLRCFQNLLLEEGGSSRGAREEAFLSADAHASEAWLEDSGGFCGSFGALSSYLS